MKRLYPFLILLFVGFGFFYQSVLFGKIPFPGDLLIADYAPWKYNSFFGFNPGSFPNKAQYFDVLQQLYPWRQLVVSAIQQGKFPLWNPYSFSGAPLFANIQSAVLNPVNILFFLFPFSSAWAMTVMLQCLFSSIGMYLFSRKLRLSILPSLLASIAYSYSLFMTVFLEYNTIGYVMALLPICAYTWLQYLEKQTFIRLAVFTLFLTLLFFVGHLQLAVVAFIFLFAFTIVFPGRKYAHIRDFVALLIPFIFSVLIASIQLLPAFELVALSARVPQDYTFLTTKLLVQPWQLIMMVVPDIFGNPATRNFLPNQTYPTKALSVGIVTLFFAASAIWEWRKKREVTFFSIAAFIVLILVTLNPFTQFFYKLQIPLFSTSSPSNMIFISSFCISILAGFGMESWLLRKSEKKAVIFFLGIVLMCFLLSLPQKPFFQGKNIVFSSVFLGSALVLFLVGNSKKQWREKISGFMLLCLVGELFFFFQKFNPFVPPTTIYPKSAIIEKLQALTPLGERVWSFGSASLEPNIPAAIGLNSPEGYDPLYPSYYGQLLAASKDGKIPQAFDSTTRSNARLAPLPGQDEISQRARFRILDVLSVRYVLDRAENGSSEKTFPVDRFNPVYRSDGWTIYENTKSLPRAWLASSYAFAPSASSFQKQFFSSAFPYTSKVTLEENPRLDVTMSKGSVTQFLSLPDRMLFKSTSDGNAIFVLSQTYYPGWQAFVDGKQETLLRVDHALTGLVVPKGEHDVVFYYWPKSFVFGCGITIISSIGFLFVAYFMEKRKV